MEDVRQLQCIYSRLRAHGWDLTFPRIGCFSLEVDSILDYVLSFAQEDGEVSWSWVVTMLLDQLDYPDDYGVEPQAVQEIILWIVGLLEAVTPELDHAQLYHEGETEDWVPLEPEEEPKGAPDQVMRKPWGRPSSRHVRTLTEAPVTTVSSREIGSLPLVKVQ